MSLERLSLAVAALLLLGLTAFNLSLPGLHYDEAVEVVPAMQWLSDQPVTTFRDNGLLLAGKLVPLMTQDYIGALNTYLALPFFLLLGVSVTSLRLMTVAVAVLTLCLASRLAREMAGPVASSVTALLLAVSPTFVFWSRQGVFVTSVTAAIGLAAALAWIRWWRSGRPGDAITGAFLFGLGTYAKLLFLWLIAGLAAAAVVGLILQCHGRPHHAWARLRARVGSWRTLAGCGLGWTAGCAPLLAYNLQTGGTLDSVGSNLTTSYYGTNNLAFFPNLLERLGQFAVALSGAHLWYLGGQFSNWLSIGLFLVAFAATMWLIRHDPAKSLPALLPFVVIGGVIIASCATVSALWVTHFAVLSPWPPLAIGCSVAYVMKRRAAPAHAVPPAIDGSASEAASSGHHMGPALRFLPGLVLAALVCVGAAWMGDVVTDVRYHLALASSGGLGAHSDAVYDLADWLQAAERQRNQAGQPALRVAAMDWGISAPVSILTRGSVAPVELFGYTWESDAALTVRLEQVIRQPEAIFLWRAPDEIIFNRSAEFRALYIRMGLEENIMAAFYERSGRPVLGATQLVASGTAVNPPQPLTPQ